MSHNQCRHGDAHYIAPFGSIPKARMLLALTSALGTKQPSYKSFPKHSCLSFKGMFSTVSRRRTLNKEVT